MDIYKINSKSAGSYEFRQINGREHIVTRMVSLEANSVMNGIFYAANEVASSFSQLNELPAPAGHPVVNGEFASASNPLAVNAHNIGGIVLDPTMDSRGRVINELAFDVAVAKSDRRGREVLKRIKNRSKIGVSTGLSGLIKDDSGEANGREYTQSISNIRFDHVAVLLDETPAGQNTFTLNSDVTNLSNKTADKKEEPLKMDHVIDLSDLSLEDRNRIKAQNAKGILALIDKKPTVEEATSVVEGAGFKVNKINEDDYKLYLENKDEFEKYKKESESQREELVNKLSENSDISPEEISTMSTPTLEKLVSKLTPQQDYSVNACTSTHANSQRNNNEKQISDSDLIEM